VVAAGLRIFDRFNSAGGGLLAGGLAYAALFAIVPAVLLLSGVVGLIVRDPAERARVVDAIAGVLPPLRELIETVLNEAARDAAPVSILGAVALVWGTSRFAVAFQDALARVMGGDRVRGLLASNLGAFAAVALMIGAIVLSTLLSGVLAFLEAGEALGVIPLVGGAVSIALGLVPVVAVIGATMLVYRIVPIPQPRWGAVVIPGIAVGLALTIVARLFAFLAPRLIGSAALLGTLATAFIALAWLALSFQALLLGAAWVRDRNERITPEGAKTIQV
jgi:membrane protein